MSRSFASVVKFKWNVSSHKRLWNRAFRSKEHVNLRGFGFTANSATEACPGCETCDEWPNYGSQEGYISIHKYDVSGRGGVKLYYGGKRKYSAYRKRFDTPFTYLDAVKMSSK